MNLPVDEWWMQLTTKSIGKFKSNNGLVDVLFHNYVCSGNDIGLLEIEVLLNSLMDFKAMNQIFLDELILLNHIIQNSAWDYWNQ